LVCLRLPDGDERQEAEECLALAQGAGLQVAGVIHGSRRSPHPATFVGPGKLEAIRHEVQRTAVEVVIFNLHLSPGQERELERRLDCRVLDRTALILDIFAQRARTYEGKLQVELAQLRHLATRLVRGWTHLERQKGGIGLRGPGEAQLETDRRLIRARIRNIDARLDKVRRRRARRRERRRDEAPFVSLVGYTNAGKSTLFNRLVGASVHVADQPFATLDPTHRSYAPAPGRQVMLSDTVGFIRNLPHELVAAFRATLEEVCNADLLLHVVDLSDADHPQRIAQVNQVIERIGAAQVPQLLVCNKLDRCDEPSALLAADVQPGTAPIYLSARSGAGCETLAEAVSRFFWGRRRHYRVCLPASAGRLRALLFEHRAVVTERASGDGGWLLELHLEPGWLERLCRETGVSEARIANPPQPWYAPDPSRTPAPRRAGHVPDPPQPATPWRTPRQADSNEHHGLERNTEQR